MRASWPALLLLAACAAPPHGPRPADTADTGATAPGQVDAGPDVVTPVGQPVTFRGQGGVQDPSWDLGDGTRASAREVTHTYGAPGNHTATFTVTLADGRRVTDAVRVTAHLPAADPAPAAASPVAILGGEAWAAVPEAGHLAAVDLTTGAAQYVPACAGPRTVAPARGRLLVACEDDDALAMVSPDGHGVDLLPLPAGSRPYGVVVRGDTAWVTAQGTGEVLRLDLDDPRPEAVVVGSDPRALVVDDAGRAWATRLRSTGQQGALLAEAGPILLEPDPGPDSDTGNRGVPSVLRALVMSPDGGTLYVGGTLANVARGTWRDGQPLTFETTVRATLRVLRDGTEDFAARRQLDNQGEVSALALTPLGDQLWAAHMGTGTLTRLDAWTLRTTGSVQGAGRGVDALAVTDDGLLLVHAWLDRSLHAYDASDPRDPTPARLWSAPTVAAEPLPAQVLRGKQLFHDSADVRMARHGYVTCAACHPDGRDDGLVWDFTDRGEGLRNTISLEGRAGTGMGPVHWSGNFDEIHDFEADIRGPQGGLGLLDDAAWEATRDPLGPSKAGRSADLDALAAYVGSLDRLPPSPFQAPHDGAARFQAAGCPACHPPDRAYTDSAPGVRHDVGTLTPASGQRLGGPLDGLDTPTLLGAWATAPYLHDGSAPTLEAAIRAHRAGAYDASGLSDDDVALLAAFVRSL